VRGIKENESVDSESSEEIKELGKVNKGKEKF